MNTTKIIMNKVRLINWYGFRDRTIPLGKDMTLIVGENGSGKSTILDAIKYAYIGDTQFNKATSAAKNNNTNRTLVSYTRCLINPDGSQYARPDSSSQNTYTHIAIEYYNELDEQYFVLGTIIDTGTDNNPKSSWYVAENKKLEDLELTYKNDNNQTVVCGEKEFKRYNNIETMNKNIAIDKFTNMTNLNLKGKYLTAYQRKLRNMMTYAPTNKTSEFIKNSVVEEKTIDLHKLKEVKNDIDSLKNSFDVIKNEVNSLDEILNLFSEYNDINKRITVNDIKVIYNNISEFKDKIDYNKKLLDKNKFSIDNLTDRKKTNDHDIESNDKAIMEANSQLENVDAYKALESDKENLKELENKLSELNEQISYLNAFSNTLLPFIDSFKSAYFEQYKGILKNLGTPNDTPAEKEEAVRITKKELENIRENYREQQYKLNDAITKNVEEIIHYQEIADTSKRHLPVVSLIEKQNLLKKSINNRFKELNINSEALFAFEYVSELTDENWRNSVETLLGELRYSVIVEPKYFNLAEELLDKSDYKYSSLVNTKLLISKNIDIAEDSVFYKLEIQNKTASKYFSYLLGHIHAVEKDKVSDYEYALSKEGKLSNNLNVTYLNFKDLKFYCLGEKASELNLKNAEKQIEKLNVEKANLLTELNDINSLISKISGNLDLFMDFDYSAPEKLDKTNKEISTLKEGIFRLEEALKKDSQYTALAERLGQLESKKKELKNLNDKLVAELSSLKTESENLSNTNLEFSKNLKIEEETLADKKIEYPIESNLAFEEYTKAKEENKTLIWAEKTRSDWNTRLKQTRESLLKCQAVYNSTNGNNAIPDGVENENLYKSRRDKIYVDNLQKVQSSLNEQTRKYERIFKNEFILKILNNINSAHEELREINKELKKLKFANTYEFEIDTIDPNGTSEYSRILNYALFLNETHKKDTDQLSFTLGDYSEEEEKKREEEIKQVIENIISKNDDTHLNDYSDYRNYLKYDIFVTNNEYTKSRMSKITGFNSGAETQIPYLIILSAALSMFYNARSNSARLIFIDEPFEKMSGQNIKIMLEFFKNQNFQVIFCAPQDRLDVIGSECDVIIPVIKKNNTNMFTGECIFHD